MSAVQQILAAEAAAEGGGGVTYLLEENFEATGYDNSWSETGATTPNEDYTGVVLQGSQSCRFVTAAQTCQTTHALASGYSTLEVYFLFRFATLYDVETTLIRINDASDVQVATIRLQTAGTLRIRSAGVSPQASTTDAISTGITYHGWLRYIKGTGADAFASVEFNTTGVRAGSGSKYASVNTGGATTDGKNIVLGPGNSVTTDFVIDRVLALDGSIGNSP